MILFLVEIGNAHVLTYAREREDAKRKAFHWLSSNDAGERSTNYYIPDTYTVTPLTEPGDRIHFAITLSA